MISTSSISDSTSSIADVIEAVRAVPDPELPVISIADLGILRDISVEGDRVVVTITPTYSGCPAMDSIRTDVTQACHDQGYDDVEVRTVLSPAWTTDWMTDEGKAALESYGVAPPGKVTTGKVFVPLGMVSTSSTTEGTSSTTEGTSSTTEGTSSTTEGTSSTIEGTSSTSEGIKCPQCGSLDTRELSRFGSTACKALWSCNSCREPFDHFKAF